MDNDKKKIGSQSDKSKDPMEIIAGTYIDWGKSKEQVWLELEKRMKPSEPVKVRVMFSPLVKIAMAAVFLLLVGFSVFMKLYTKTFAVPVAQHSRISLPDRSIVNLNAQSSISYKPLLWIFSRNVRFEGEAFFEVQKGRRFQVISANGRTEVLGTSFNIFARDNNYDVTCITGNVKVTVTENDQTVFLNPGDKATLDQEGRLVVNSGSEIEQALSWMNNKLNFTSVPLINVLKEIERQYGVFISTPENFDSIYTGTLSVDNPIEQTLDMVCKPFDLSFTLKSKDEYIISRKEQNSN